MGSAPALPISALCHWRIVSLPVSTGTARRSLIVLQAHTSDEPVANAIPHRWTKNSNRVTEHSPQHRHPHRTTLADGTPFRLSQCPPLPGAPLTTNRQ